jgi:hypothetical protein
MSQTRSFSSLGSSGFKKSTNQQLFHKTDETHKRRAKEQPALRPVGVFITATPNTLKVSLASSNFF